MIFFCPDCCIVWDSSTPVLPSVDSWDADHPHRECKTCETERESVVEIEEDSNSDLLKIAFSSGKRVMIFQREFLDETEYEDGEIPF